MVCQAIYGNWSTSEGLLHGHLPTQSPLDRTYKYLYICVVPAKALLTQSRGNVFKDLGFPAEEAEHLWVRSDLMIHLQKVIQARGLRQTDAARLLGVSQPRVSDLMQGKINLFSVDTLIDMLARAGVRIKIRFTRSKHRKAA